MSAERQVDVTCFHAIAIADARGVLAAPGCVLARSDAPWPALTILAAGAPQEVAHHPAARGAIRVDFPETVLLPGFVNAHTHLDLTSVGPRPYDPAGGFIGWIDSVRRSRLTGLDGVGEAAYVRRAVAEGARRSLAGGVVAVGDIAGNARREPVEALEASPLAGVSFLEFFGLGTRQPTASAAIDQAVQWIRERSAARVGRIRVGLQPHATYSAGLRVYAQAERWRRQDGVPVASHVAEALAERQFIADAAGPIRTFLESLGLWEPAILDEVGHRRTPLQHVADVIASGGRGWLLAHVNDCDDRGIEILARAGASVAYCARCHDYFGHQAELGPHRYRDMLAAGVNVALGTDSVINLPPHQASRITPLDDARLLHARDAADPALLLGMLTINGARALGLDPLEFQFPRAIATPQPLAGLVAVDVSDTPPDAGPLQRVLRSGNPARLLGVAR